MFLFAFVLVPLSYFGILSMMPSETGEARLNNYYLDKIN